MRGGGIVMLLRGFRGGLRRDGDGLLGAAFLRVLLRVLQDFRAVRSRVIEAGRRGQRILPMTAGR